MIYDFKGDAYTMTFTDFKFWDVLHCEPWKEGIVRLHLRMKTHATFCLAYCSVDLLLASEPYSI